jgi:hypothetical protein
MGTTEVRSPWSLERNQPQPQRGISPGSRSSPSNRADGGHIAGHVGKGWRPPPSTRRDNALVQGGYQSPLDPRE